MTKILLINPPTSGAFYASVTPPLGILYVDSYLRSKGEDTSFIDLNVLDHWERRFEEAVLKESFAIAGITSNISNYSMAIKLARKLKSLRKKILVVAGGPLPSVCPQMYLDNGFDYVVKGEGEITFHNFVQENSPVEGMYMKGDNKARFTGEGEIAVDLDALPFPSLDRVDLRRYFVNFSKSRPVSSLLTSRGCPHECIFCNKSVFGSRWRARSSQNVMAEIQWQVKTLGAREICVMDDNFTLDRERVSNICSAIRSDNIRFSWQCQNGLRADSLDEDLLRQMRQSGCWKIGIAPESGDQEVLARIDKRLDLGQVKKVNSWCRTAGICVHAFFMLGFPFEDAASMNKTVDFAMGLDPVIADFAKVFPLPGTRLFEDYGCKFTEGGLYDIRLEPAKEKLFKLAYRRFYARPGKIMDILRNIGWKNFFHLFGYGVRIGLLN